MRYFRTRIERGFLQYYFCLGEYAHFADHTGYHCQQRWLRILENRMHKLVDIFQQAKRDMDLETLGLLQRGKFKLDDEDYDREPRQDD